MYYRLGDICEAFGMSRVILRHWIRALGFVGVAKIKCKRNEFAINKSVVELLLMMQYMIDMLRMSYYESACVARAIFRNPYRRDVDTIVLQYETDDREIAVADVLRHVDQHIESLTLCDPIQKEKITLLGFSIHSMYKSRRMPEAPSLSEIATIPATSQNTIKSTTIVENTPGAGTDLEKILEKKGNWFTNLFF